LPSPCLPRRATPHTSPATPTLFAAIDLAAPPACSYNDFVMEETKREWRWANLHAKELHIWSQVPAFLGCKCTQLAAGKPC
jgi:hypothetical protein